MSIAECEGWLSLRGVARRLGMPTMSLYRLLWQYGGKVRTKPVRAPGGTFRTFHPGDVDKFLRPALAEWQARCAKRRRRR